MTTLECLCDLTNCAAASMPSDKHYLETLLQGERVDETEKEGKR